MYYKCPNIEGVVHWEPGKEDKVMCGWGKPLIGPNGVVEPDHMVEENLHFKANMKPATKEEWRACIDWLLAYSQISEEEGNA